VVLIVIGSAGGPPGRRAEPVGAARAVATQSRADDGTAIRGDAR
jgi:hypothetical protein